MTAAMRKHFYTGKKSEYRQNYLPFDYYDFWITAKENENLRCRNKLRDYLHTPFDWDEDQEVYLENRPIGSVEVINHATQTTERPNRHDHLQIKANQKPQQVHQHQQQQQQPQQHHVQTQQAPSRPQSAQQINNRPKSTKKSKKSKKKVGINSVVAHVQPNVAPNPYAFGVDISRPRHARSNSAREYRHTPTFEELRGYKAPVKKLEQPKQSNNGPANKNITSIAIQTPLGWNLRDFKDQRPASTSKSILIPISYSAFSKLIFKLEPSRPVSAINIRATKAPFANYGWATKTPDMSIKPTHNALANKVSILLIATPGSIEIVIIFNSHWLKKTTERPCWS